MTDPKQIDLEPLTIAELEQLSLRVGREIASKRAAGRAWLLQHGARITEAETPQYQNPNNTAQTWSGKGKQPSWVERMLAEGKTLESLKDEDILPAPLRSRPETKGGS